MATKKITQNELEEMVREMVNKMVNEVPGEAPIMEKKLTHDEKEMKEKLVKGLKKKYGKTPKTYAIATDLAKKLAEAEKESDENGKGYTDKYNDSPFLKGKQKTGLPDKIQALIHNSKAGKKDEELEEKNMSFAWQRSAANTNKKRSHYLDEETIKELERKKRAIMRQLEELNFGGPDVDEPEIETDTEEETIMPDPPRPDRSNPFRPRENDTEVIPDLEPQGNLKELERKKRAIMRQLEELNFGGPDVDEPEIETDTEEETTTTTPPRPGRPNPFRTRENDTEVIPDLEPQGSLKDVVKRYLNLKK